MVAVKTNASSQNATWRGTDSLLRSATSDWSRQSAQGWSGMRLGACAVAIVRDRFPAGSATVELMDTPGFVIVTGRSSVMPISFWCSGARPVTAARDGGLPRKALLPPRLDQLGRSNDGPNGVRGHCGQRSSMSPANRTGSIPASGQELGYLPVFTAAAG